MLPFTFTAIFTLGTSLVAATPTPVQMEVRQDETFPYPIVATYEAVMRQVDPEYQAYLEANVVINLNESDLSKKRSGNQKRQSGTCDIQGFAIVSGDLTPFEGTVTNSAANFGRAVTVTGILPGCSIGIIPQANCGLWSVTDTSGCATSRSVSFS